MVKVHWNDILSDELSDLWLSLTSDIEYLSHTKIPRLVGYGENVMIFGYCNVSEGGYAVVL